MPESKINSIKGFALPELLLSVLLLGMIFTGTMLTILKCMELSEIAANSSTAVLAAKNKMAEIENTSFSQIVDSLGDYHNVSFDINGLSGKGVTYVDVAGDMLTVNVVICWKQPNGRLFGEDVNLSGQFDAGEDSMDNNNRLDSMVELTTLKYAL